MTIITLMLHLHIVSLPCRSEKSLMTARWYSAWILFVDMIPVFLMYGIWATLTIVGKLKPNALVNMNEIIQENDEVQHRCKAWDSNSPLLLQQLSAMELSSSSSCGLSNAEDGLLLLLQSSSSAVVDIPPVSENKSTSSSSGNVTQRIRSWNESSSISDLSHHDCQPSDLSPLLEKKSSPM